LRPAQELSATQILNKESLKAKMQLPYATVLLGYRSLAIVALMSLFVAMTAVLPLSPARVFALNLVEVLKNVLSLADTDPFIVNESDGSTDHRQSLSSPP
jgi:hypothetical protein